MHFAIERVSNSWICLGRMQRLQVKNVFQTFMAERWIQRLVEQRIGFLTFPPLPSLFLSPSHFSKFNCISHLFKNTSKDLQTNQYKLKQYKYKNIHWHGTVEEGWMVVDVRDQQRPLACQGWSPILPPFKRYTSYNYFHLFLKHKSSLSCLLSSPVSFILFKDVCLQEYILFSLNVEIFFFVWIGDREESIQVKPDLYNWKVLNIVTFC